MIVVHSCFPPAFLFPYLPAKNKSLMLCIVGLGIAVSLGPIMSSKRKSKLLLWTKIWSVDDSGTNGGRGDGAMLKVLSGSISWLMP